MLGEVEGEAGEVSGGAEVAFEVMEFDGERGVARELPGDAFGEAEAVVAHGPGGDGLAFDSEDGVVEDVAIGGAEFQGVKMTRGLGGAEFCGADIEGDDVDCFFGRDGVFEGL